MPTFPMQRDDTLPAPPAQSRGFDVSKYSGSVDFPRFKADGFDFVIVRATVAMTIDPKFRAYVKAAVSAGLIVGTYPAFFDTHNPVFQAKVYYDTCASEGLTDGSVKALVPSNDFEMYHVATVPTTAQKIRAIDGALAFQSEIERLWGLGEGESLFYSFPAFISEMPSCPSKTGLGLRRLWISHFNAPKPTVPRPFSKWTFWQHLGNTMVHGANVDLNRFAGPVEDLPLIQRPQPIMTTADTDRAPAHPLGVADRAETALREMEDAASANSITSPGTPTAKTSESQRLAQLKLKGRV